MANAPKYVPLPGSTRTTLEGSREFGPTDPTEMVEVTVILRGRSSSEALAWIRPFGQLPRQRGYLTRLQFAQLYGATEEDIARVQAFAGQHLLTVLEANPPRRTVRLRGDAAAMSAAFRVALTSCGHPAGNYRGRKGPVHIPLDLKGIILGVFGLDTRPQARQHFRRFKEPPDTPATLNRHAYSPRNIARAYNFPAGDGQGQCIALIHLGGGFNASDLQCNWQEIGVVSASVTAVSVGGARDRFLEDPDGPDPGVTLHLAVLGSVAPRAKLVVYFAENTEAGFLNAITTAIHDVYHPSILSIAWGAPELSWTQQAIAAIDQAFQEAAALGVTVCAASGDEGSTDGVSDGRAHVDFPAASPHVLACGGTSLRAFDEVVWNELASGNGATGGGITSSETFSAPTWQVHLNVPASVNDGHCGRGVPDVAANADPCTGYKTQVKGESFLMGGTGAAVATWAGLVALINGQLGKPVGYINPFLAIRAHNPKGFRSITQGNNGAYQAGPGWNACCGLGSPVGSELLGLFAGDTSVELSEQTLRQSPALAPDSRSIKHEIADVLISKRSPEVDRFLLAQLRQGEPGTVLADSVAINAPSSHRPTWVSVKIGRPQKEWLPEHPTEPFPDHLLPPERGGHVLKVVLSASRILSEPLQTDIALPRRGESTVATFDLGVLPEGPDVTLRFTVLHRNRVLQSAVLRVPIGAAEAYLTVDAAIVGDLSQLFARASADVSLLVNETPDVGARILSIAGDLARDVGATISEPLIANIISELGRLAGDREQNALPLQSPEKLGALRNLAVMGERVFSYLRELLGNNPAAEHMPPYPISIQIVAAHPSELHLLEFAYDYPVPGADREDISLCPHWRAAEPVAQGTANGCYAHCLLTTGGAHVCPNGFWGVKKLIERHAFRRESPDPISIAPARHRKLLDLRGTAAALGVSTVVHQANAEAVDTMMASLRKTLDTRPTEKITSWRHLQELVASYGPRLIVLLPHIQRNPPYAGPVPAAPGSFLEIETELKRSSEISRADLVKDNRPPLVLLLGCEAAVVYSKFDNCLTDFRRAGAAVILAPIATVAPANVTEFVSQFVGALKTGIGSGQPHIGAALRDARRAEFFNGNLHAVGIMAFGDGDWRISL